MGVGGLGTTGFVPNTCPHPALRRCHPLPLPRPRAERAPGAQPGGSIPSAPNPCARQLNRCTLCPPPPPSLLQGVPQDIDLIAASFVRKGSDLDYIRKVGGAGSWLIGWEVQLVVWFCRR